MPEKSVSDISSGIGWAQVPASLVTKSRLASALSGGGGYCRGSKCMYQTTCSLLTGTTPTAPGQAAALRMKLVEIVAGPLDRPAARGDADQFHHLGLARRPVREQSLPGP